MQSFFAKNAIFLLRKVKYGAARASFCARRALLHYKPLNYNQIILLPYYILPRIAAELKYKTKVKMNAARRKRVGRHSLFETKFKKLKRGYLISLVRIALSTAMSITPTSAATARISGKP